jgi:hypothetical protein
MSSEMIQICTAIMFLSIPLMWSEWLRHKERMARIKKENEGGPVQSDDQEGK